MQDELIALTPPPEPYSKRGDKIHTLCSVILDWLIEFGDQDMKAQALQTRAYWEESQVWLLQWASQVKFFQFAEAACADLPAFKKAMETLPPETQMVMDYWVDGQEEPKKIDVVIWLAMKAGERYKKSINLRGKRVR